MSNQVKRKTSMVLHQIEEALGEFVLNHGEIDSLNIDALENIHQREVDKGRIFNKQSIKDVVEATYLDELFGFALDISQDSSLQDSINYLYSLFHQLDIYQIRNAISHPNKPFWDCYWYRVASIASDPVNEILGLSKVKSALVAAENGSLIDPPDEWVNKVIWQIPNNLPAQFDHSLTGLIGRSKELAELKKYILNPRVNTVALVAPGGSGKTALALDLLNNVVSSPTYSKHVDSVIYCTLKTEKLTSSGVVALDSIETIDELKEEITFAINSIYDENFEEFDSAIAAKKNESILLCIDNLETLLRDSQESFEQLNYELPPAWKVLVTSRVSISNATILSLDALKEGSANHLAKTYLIKRGGSEIEYSAITKLTRNCFFNPLAIRLTIDLIITGKDIPSSLNVANKEIAEFSYNNLIEVLSECSIEILEAVFVEGKSTRFSLCEVLEKSLDEISSAVGELTKTSLISRIATEQGETYSLSDSVRDLLVISPRNIATRTKVQNFIHERRVLSNQIDIKQASKELPSWHADYIDKSTPENLKILVTEVNQKIGRARKNTDIAISLFKKVKDYQFMYGENALYHQAYARVLEVLKDYKNAEEHFKTAIRLDSDSPTSRYLLGRLFHSTNRYDEARNEYQALIDQGWTAENSEISSFAKSVFNGYFLAMLFSGKYEDVLEATKEWKHSSLYRGLLGTFRASAWKRKMENLVSENPVECIDALIRASRIMNDVFRNEGYFKTACSQAFNIFNEIQYCLARKEYVAKFPKECCELLNFVATHIQEIALTKNEADINSLMKSLERVELELNPFSENKWGKVGANDYHEDIEPIGGLVTVAITNRPKDKASFLFARDAFQNDYFLHFDNFKDGNWRNWCQLSIGTKLDIVIDESHNDNKAKNAKEIYYQQ